jgi:hypothetical protein
MLMNPRNHREATMTYTFIYPTAVVTHQLYKDVPAVAENEFVWEPEGKEEVFYLTYAHNGHPERCSRSADAIRG